ncbi:MAG: septum site-determining protein MinD, partial [Clostridiales bacterium]|nr:septum site-determining protein MinD [Clostridiales bacterium]
MGQVTVITSGKGGTGKTTACAAVSSCLVALGHKTLAVDCDVGLRNLDISLGMSDFTVSDIADVAESRIELLDAAHEHPQLPGLFFLSAPLYRLESAISPESTARLFDIARDNFEHVLVDSPAGLGSGFEFAARHADRAIVVATADPASIRNAGRAVEPLFEMG